MSARRRFLKGVAAVGGALAWSARHAVAQQVFAPDSAAPRSALRLLILGGTGAIGPYHVRAALERGHHVAVFSRGKTHADLPAGVERVIGDRNGDLAAIRTRDWDAIIDIATYGPGWIRSLADAFGGRVPHYTFISTVSVYDNPPMDRVTTEDSPVLAYRGTADPYAVVSHVGDDYGALKVLCEREAEKQFPNRTLILRPSYIAGPGDSRALTYWAVRAEKGGELLVGSNPATPVQYIDVRDFAEWTVRLVERRVVGTFNAVGPTAPTNLAHIVSRAVTTLSPTSRVTWVPTPWFLEQGHAERWGTLLFFSHGIANIMRMSNDRAVASGLTTRPVDVTLRDILSWYHSLPAERTSSLITGFQRQSNGTWTAATSTWTAYLAHERELLAAWHRRTG